MSVQLLLKLKQSGGTWYIILHNLNLNSLTYTEYTTYYTYTKVGRREGEGKREEVKIVLFLLYISINEQKSDG